MKRLGLIIIPIVFLSLLVEGSAFATPSTTYWTPATSDVQPFNVWHITYDSYFRLFRTAAECAPTGGGSAPGQCSEGPLGGAGSLSTVVGLTVGVLPYEKLNLEVGIDGLFPGTRSSPALRSIGNSLLFNAKFGTPEGAFFGSWFPALNVGIFNVGTKDQVTNMDIVDFLVGKTLGPFGRLHGGYYIGNAGSALMRESGCIRNHPTLGCGTVGGGAGSLQNSGGMVGYDYGFWLVKDDKGNEYNKWVFAADYASGKNFIGGGGFGMYYYFTKDIDLLTGPVWFNDHIINGQWKWTLQLDINF